MSDVITTDGDITGVVDNMVKSEALARSGEPYSATVALGDDAPEPVAPSEPPNPADLGITLVMPGDAAWAAALSQGEPVAPPVPPGLTARGWSPEVTARHPDLLAATMEELASGDDPAAAEPIDPTDPAALERARAAFNNFDQHKIGLMNSAIKLNFMRLVQGLRDAGQASPVVQAAYTEAIEAAKAMTSEGAAETATATSPTTSSTPPPPTSSTSSSTTPASTSA